MAFWTRRVRIIDSFDAWLTDKAMVRIQPVGSKTTSNITVAGHTWDLWKGPNANWEVLSFVSTAGNLNDFSVDLNEFFRKSLLSLALISSHKAVAEYLTAEQGVSSAQVKSQK